MKAEMTVVKSFIQNVLQDIEVDDEWRQRVAEVGAFMRRLATNLDEEALEELIAAGALHPLAEIRRAVVDVARDYAGQVEAARRFLLWSLNDVDEQVAVAAIAAIKACAALRDEEVWTALYTLIGRASSRAIVEHQLAPASLRELAVIQFFQQLQQEGSSINFSILDPSLSPVEEDDELVLNRQVDLRGMIKIEAGPYIAGLSNTSGLPGWFSIEDTISTCINDIKTFHIDRDPVTNDEYDAFCAIIEEHGHLWCHPDETPGKDHRRAMWGDPRVAGDHPVSGVDWYDAYAYAAWRGKKLPTEEQWEKAACGSQGQRYPWGESYQAARVQDAEQAYGKSISSLTEYLQTVTQITPAEPARLTVPVAELPGNVSPYGVRGMIGNVWEWTCSRYLDRVEIEPHFRALDPLIVQEDWSSWVTVKGGAWSSIAEQLLPSYRGRRHILFRSPDVGFRCVYEP